MAGFYIGPYVDYNMKTKIIKPPPGGFFMPGENDARLQRSTTNR